MIIRTLILVLTLCGSFASPLFAGTVRGDRLVSATGGVAGTAGIAGISGLPGPSSVFDFSDFFALMPGDNAATVAPNTAVSFPQDGPSNGVITRLTASTFLLPLIGTYKVYFQVSVDEAAQLQLRVAGIPIPDSVVGRATGTDQVVGVSIVRTTIPGSVLEVINPAGNVAALTITPVAGGARSVSAHLVILRIE